MSNDQITKLLDEFDRDYPGVTDVQTSFRRVALLDLIRQVCGQNVKS